MILSLEKVSVVYNDLRILHEVSFGVGEGEIVALMGPNGAGKSTILKATFGLTPIAAGKVFFKSKELVPIPHAMVKFGVSFVTQGKRVFDGLSVQDNLELMAIHIKEKSILTERISDVYKLFPILKEKKNELSGDLSGGQKQLLAIARGLITDPCVMFLDEPTIGLAPKVVKEVFDKIKEVNEKRGTSFVIVEHNLKSLLSMVDRAYVLNRGEVVYEGGVEKMQNDKVLEKALLG